MILAGQGLAQLAVYKTKHALAAVLAPTVHVQADDHHDAGDASSLES